MGRVAQKGSAKPANRLRLCVAGMRRLHAGLPRGRNAPLVRCNTNVRTGSPAPLGHDDRPMIADIVTFTAAASFVAIRLDLSQCRHATASPRRDVPERGECPAL